MTFTSGLPAYSGAKAISPPTVGQPKQLPYQEMPETTPLMRCRVLRSAGQPKRSETRIAMGRAPQVKISLGVPPTPVAAPSHGIENHRTDMLSLFKPTP